MNQIMALLGVLLLASAAINALQFSTIGELREKVGAMDNARATAVSAAETCSASVQNLAKASAEQKAAHQAQLEAARAAGVSAGRRAERERNRKQAVPGDACASAQVETDEWLRERQGGAHGR